MRILVTGATGFIGSALCPKLEERGHDLWKMVRYVSGRYDFWYTGQCLFADLRDAEAVHEAVARAKPEVIIHLGAQSAVSYSFLSPNEVIQTNLGGSQTIADAALKTGAFLIHASSSEVYGVAKHFPILEDEPLAATSPYAVSKIAAEGYIKVLMQTRGLKAAILRPFNTFGRANVRNDHFVVERAITQALTSGVIKLHDPKPERDFLFRDDHVRSYLLALENLERISGEVINIATGGCWQIAEMAKFVADIVGNRQGREIGVEFTEIPDRPLDMPKLQGDNSKASSLLGWIPHYSFSTGLKKAVEEWAKVLGK